MAAYIPPSSAAASMAALGGGPGRRRVTLVRQHDAVAREANRLKDHIVSRLGLGHQLAELCGGTDQITLI